MPDDDLDYRQMRARVEKRVKKRAEFVLHLSIYVTANLMIWGLFLLLASRSEGKEAVLIAPTLLTLGWGLGLVAHGVDTYLQTGALDGMRERELRREIALERLRRGITDDDDSAMADKPKKEAVKTLSHDGVMGPVEDDLGVDREDDNVSSRRSYPSKSGAY